MNNPRRWLGEGWHDLFKDSDPHTAARPRFQSDTRSYSAFRRPAREFVVVRRKRRVPRNWVPRFGDRALGPCPRIIGTLRLRLGRV
jgi:hypothetical protein